MFPKDVETVTITDEHDLTSLLDRADDHPLVLERSGVRYVLNRADVGAYYDPTAAREAMRSVAGTLPKEVIDEMRAQLARRRERSNLPVGS